MHRILLAFLAIFSMAFITEKAFSHCDTMDGPLVKDTITALKKNNVNYVLKWVSKEMELEVVKAFTLTMKVRALNKEAKELADNYFYDTVVRIHRNGEGESFTGVKPHGTPIDEVIKAADKAIEIGNLSPLKKFVKDDQIAELKKRFEKVLNLKDFDINDVAKGREYIEAYVQFFKYAEGEDEIH